MNKKLLVFALLLAILVFSMGVIAEPIIDLELILFKNDNIDERWVRLGEGLPSEYYGEGGNYVLKVLDESGNEIFSQLLDIYFGYQGAVVPGIDYSDWTSDNVLLYYRIPYNSNMRELKFYHGDKLIFSKVFNFCNNDGVCDTTSETYETCPQDCPLDHNDILCIAESDSICDPDCGQDVDPDCENEFYPYAGEDKQVKSGKSLKFEGEVKNAGSGTYAYKWSFEDDESTETGQKVTHKFKEEGVYAVDLIVTNQDGVYKEDTLLVTVSRKKSIKEKILGLWQKIISLFGGEPSDEGLSAGEQIVTCATEVVFNIESVCKSGDGYEISVDNEGKRDIAGWKVRFWQTAKEAEQTDSLRATGAGESKKIIAKPENLTSIRMIELTPLIKTEEKEFRCNQIIESYGNLEGEPITEECDK